MGEGQVEVFGSYGKIGIAGKYVDFIEQLKSKCKSCS